MQVNKYQLKRIRNILKKMEINLYVNKDFMIIDASHIEKSILNKAKELIYSLLNFYEKHYFILIKGIPYCLISEATDHVIYNKVKNGHYTRVKQCFFCKYSPRCPGIRRNLMHNFLSMPPLFDKPTDIAIEVNKNCNLGCEFCINNNYKKIGLKYDKIKKVLDEAKNLDIRYVRFTGGEPLLSSDIIKILKYAKSKNFYIFLNTNGTLLNDYFIEELEKYVDNILISLCGYNFYIENEINFSGHLLINKFKNIVKLHRSKIPYIRIGTVISKFLIDSFDKYSFLIKTLGIKIWELYRPMLPLSITQKFPNYNVSKNDLLKLLSFIYKLRKSAINVYFANAIPFCITNKSIYKPLMRGAQFDDGHSRLVFDSRGFFKPSYFIDVNLGNSIKKAWSNTFIKKINSLEYLPSGCHRCPYIRWCLGGSRYMAKENFGDYFACDPLMKN